MLSKNSKYSHINYNSQPLLYNTAVEAGIAISTLRSLFLYTDKAISPVHKFFYSKYITNKIAD